ncbi:MAG: class I SAM-dependent methyltransferase [Candidatus Hydrogenedentota bacterium]
MRLARKGRNSEVNDALTTKDTWESVWSDVHLPVVAKPVHDLQRQLKRHLPQGSACSFIEIGCAPGGWMAYFSRAFGYRVAGLEYAEHAAETTKRNMELLGMDAEVLVKDFFAYECGDSQYDVVFSKGFIEHYPNLTPVVAKICLLSRQYVVTIVPNLYGVNGFLSKVLRPAVYAEHHPIDAALLESEHRKCGLETMFCNYVGGVRLIMPAGRTVFFKRHKNLAKAVNFPVRVFNRLSMLVGRALEFTPRQRATSQYILYIGRKPAPDTGPGNANEDAP